MDESKGESSDLDPRIQIELEKLNSTTDEINKLEIDYDVSLIMVIISNSKQYIFM